MRNGAPGGGQRGQDQVEDEGGRDEATESIMALCRVAGWLLCSTAKGLASRVPMDLSAILLHCQSIDGPSSRLRKGGHGQETLGDVSCRVCISCLLPSPSSTSSKICLKLIWYQDQAVHQNSLQNWKE